MVTVRSVAKGAGTVALLDVAVKLTSAAIAVAIAVKAIKALATDR